MQAYCLESLRSRMDIDEIIKWLKMVSSSDIAGKGKVGTIILYVVILIIGCFVASLYYKKIRVPILEKNCKEQKKKIEELEKFQVEDKKKIEELEKKIEILKQENLKRDMYKWIQQSEGDQIQGGAFKDFIK